MTTHHKKASSELTIVEAVETLSHIADLDNVGNIGISQSHDLLINDQQMTYHTVHWLHRENASITIEIVRKIFCVILNYLRNFYRKQFISLYDQHTIDGIKTIMVLVGEAAKKLDKYTRLFYRTQTESVTKLKEYRKLQDFYLSRIDRKIDEGLLGKWIVGLSQKTKTDKRELNLIGRKSKQTQHIFVDLDSVKKDTEYELFYMRKEDGTRFFSPRLIRNIKLVNNFENYFSEEKGEDPLSNLDIWQDRVVHANAKNILWAAQRVIKKFYQKTKEFRENELVEKVNKTLMALMLAANPHNLSHNLPIKNCCDYFYNFQAFLRECLLCDDYKRMITYPPGKASRVANCLLETIHSLCLAEYTQLTGYHELLSLIHGMIYQSKERGFSERENRGLSKNLWSNIAGEYTALTALLKLHPNGSLNKILNSFEVGDYNHFDPLFQKNTPSQLFSAYINEKKCLFTRWPSPTNQEFIHKAHVTDEFKGFLRACIHDNNFNKSLIFNLQDRVDWREHFRSIAIEDLSSQETFAKHIEVVTFSKDSDFYFQLAPYHSENNANIFLKNFKIQLFGNNFGFYFPEYLKKKLFTRFVDDVLRSIHETFFSSQEILVRTERMDFIEIFYLFLQLKIIDIIRPNIISFCCKDSLDIGCSAGALLFIFLKFLTQARLSEHDQEHLELIIYGPCLLQRERLILSDRFNRMASVIKALEIVKERYQSENFIKMIHKNFGCFYKTSILKAKPIIQQDRDILS